MSTVVFQQPSVISGLKNDFARADWFVGASNLSKNSRELAQVVPVNPQRFWLNVQEKKTFTQFSKLPEQEYIMHRVQSLHENSSFS